LAPGRGSKGLGFRCITDRFENLRNVLGCFGLSVPATRAPIFTKSLIRGRARFPYLAEGVPNGTRLATAEFPGAACEAGTGARPQPFKSSTSSRKMGNIRFI
jgi:hypothetical protein